jgi:uncharacterized protein (DUF983 family)
MNATEANGKANEHHLMADLDCPSCGEDGRLAMFLMDAPRITCADCGEEIDLDRARKLAAGWAVAVRWMEATAAVLDAEGSAR